VSLQEAESRKELPRAEALRNLPAAHMAAGHTVAEAAALRTRVVLHKAGPRQPVAAVLVEAAPKLRMPRSGRKTSLALPPHNSDSKSFEILPFF